MTPQSRKQLAPWKGVRPSCQEQKALLRENQRLEEEHTVARLRSAEVADEGSKVLSPKVRSELPCRCAVNMKDVDVGRHPQLVSCLRQPPSELDVVEIDRKLLVEEIVVRQNFSAKEKTAGGRLLDSRRIRKVVVEHSVPTVASSETGQGPEERIR